MQGERAGDVRRGGEHARDALTQAWLVVLDHHHGRPAALLATSIYHDYAAIAVAVEYSWSSGHVEGQVTKIKRRTRDMYGRGTCDMLRQRVLLMS